MTSHRGNSRLTVVVVLADVFPGQCGLLFHLVPKMLLTLLQHVELGAQPQDSILGHIFLSLGGAAAEPAKAPARHFVFGIKYTQKSSRFQ